jgi:hypothetical protein
MEINRQQKRHGDWVSILDSSHDNRSIRLMVSVIIALVAFALWPSTPEAQTPRPYTATTLQTTSTASTSLLVGCALNVSSGCTGGIRGGILRLTSGLALDGATASDHGIVFASATPASTSLAMYVVGTTLYFNGSVVALGGSVTGTQYRIAYFSASNAVGDSIMAQDAGATTVTLTGTMNTTAAYQLAGVSINATGTLTNVAYKGQNNTFSTVQTFQSGISTSNGAPSTAGVMIPDAVPGATTTNLYNTGGILTWLAGAAFTTVNTGNGAYELYAMDQNVLTTSSPTFVTVTAALTGNVTGNASGSAGTVTSIASHASTELSDTAAIGYLAGVQSFTGAKTFSAVTLFTLGIKEYGRSTESGSWANQTYAAGDYTASTGTWTVEAGDVSLNRFTIVGKTVTWQINVVTTDTSATPTALRVLIPGSLTASAHARGGACGGTIDAGTNVQPAVWSIASGGTYVSLLPNIGSGNWATATANTTVVCTIVFELT